MSVSKCKTKNKKRNKQNNCFFLSKWSEYGEKWTKDYRIQHQRCWSNRAIIIIGIAIAIIILVMQPLQICDIHRRCTSKMGRCMRMCHSTIAAGATSTHRNVENGDEKSNLAETGKNAQNSLAKNCANSLSSFFWFSLVCVFSFSLYSLLGTWMSSMFWGTFCARRYGKSIQLNNRNIFRFDGDVLWFPCTRAPHLPVFCSFSVPGIFCRSCCWC